MKATISDFLKSVYKSGELKDDTIKLYKDSYNLITAKRNIENN